jgi:uncharacterized protein YcbK (DUF882 family)
MPRKFPLEFQHANIQLTPNFNLREFMQSGGVPMSPITLEQYNNIKRLVVNMQVLRNEINLRFGEGHTIHINSGYRTPARNKKIGGAKHSRHLTAEACDFRVMRNRVALPTKEIYDLILILMHEGKLTLGGLGLYNTFIHYDVGRNGKLVTWDLRK